jgi:hypothetical protein
MGECLEAVTVWAVTDDSQVRLAPGRQRSTGMEQAIDTFPCLQPTDEKDL